MIILFIILCSIIFVIVLTVLLRKIRKKPKNKIVPTKTPVEKPENHKYKLLHYAFDISGAGKSFGLFQTGKDFWIVDSSNVKNIKNLKDVYPAFSGKPIGMVVIPGNQFETNSFLIFSSDGKIYNPFSISHSWRSDFFYLPLEDPISIDGRPLEDGISNGLFSGNKNIDTLKASEGAILFRFYYSGYYIEETGCVHSQTDSIDHPSCTEGTCPQIKSCHNSKVPISPYPLSNINSFYQYANKLYGISSDGFIYVKQESQWVKDSYWTTIFNGLEFPDNTVIPPRNDNTKLYLMGADYDDGVPIFLIYENGTRYIVDKHARKYDFFHFVKNIQGNPLDLTKAGVGEFDYIVLYTDGNIYGQTIVNNSKPVSDFEQFYPRNGKLISITSVSKYQDYYLVFLYDTGEWFEIQYDIKTNKIGKLGQTDKTSGKWNEWSHVKDALSKLTGNQTFKISSFGWSIFVFDQDNLQNNIVYSINNPPESWIDMLYCSGTENSDGEYTFKTKTCVGLGDWKDFQFVKSSEKKLERPTYNGFNVYEDYGIDTSINPGILIPKISLDKCLSGDGSIFMYDQNESDCYIYKNLTSNQTFKNSSTSIFVRPESDAMFENKFCIKHKPTNKYLYWDFTDPDKQFLSTRDTCGYSGPEITPQTQPTEADLQNLQKVAGSFWSLDTSTGGLVNLNGAVGGYLDITGNMSQIPDSNFRYINGNFTYGPNSTCFHTKDGSSFSYTPECSGEWLIENIPCTTSTAGYLSNFCN